MDEKYSKQWIQIIRGKISGKDLRHYFEVLALTIEDNKDYLINFDVRELFKEE